MSWIFFFQAEDGIRDRNVTGVQTCALPISLLLRQALKLCCGVILFHFPGGNINKTICKAAQIVESVFRYDNRFPLRLPKGKRGAQVSNPHLNWGLNSDHSVAYYWYLLRRVRRHLIA